MKRWEKFVLYDIKKLLKFNMCRCCTAIQKPEAIFCPDCGYKHDPKPIMECSHPIIHPLPVRNLGDDYKEMCSWCHSVRYCDEDGPSEWKSPDSNEYEWGSESHAA